MAAPVALPLNDPSQWPLRMTHAEVARVIRVSRRELWRRIAQGRFPQADDGRTWARATVERYALGQVKEFERSAAQRKRRAGSAVKASLPADDQARRSA